MKEILRDPLFLLLIVATAIIVLMLMYNTVGRDKKFGINIEKILAGIFLFAISGASGAAVMPFMKLHPAVMAGRETTAPTVIGYIAIYGAFLFILSPRLRSTLKDYLQALLITMSSDPPLALLLLMISFSALWSESTDISLKNGLVILETTVIAIYIGKQYSWQDLYPWWRTVNLLVLFWSLFKTNGDAAGCWNGILGHKNQFSFFMAQTSVLWFLFAFYSPKNRYLAIVFGLLASLAVQKGCSGASRILVVILLGLWFYLSVIKKLPVQWAVISVILFLIISIALAIVVINNLEAIVVDGLKKDMTLTGRTEFWPLIINKINERPLLGYGVASFWQSWRGLENPAHSIIIVKSQFVPPHSHNGFLDLACDLGWGGLILFMFSFLNNIVKGVVYLTRAKLPEGGLPLFILTYTLMTNLTETGLFGATSVWFWYIVMSVRLSLDISEKT